MNAPFLLLLLVAWLLICAALAAIVWKVAPRGLARLVMTGSAFLIAIPLPIADELTAWDEVHRLCAEHPHVEADTPNVVGRTVWFGGSERSEINIGMLKGTKTKRAYVDAATQEPVYHYFRYEINGGWLGSAISEGRTPLLLRGTCQPIGIADWEKSSNITRVNRPIGQGK